MNKWKYTHTHGVFLVVKTTCGKKKKIEIVLLLNKGQIGSWNKIFPEFENTFRKYHLDKTDL